MTFTHGDPPSAFRVCGHKAILGPSSGHFTRLFTEVSLALPSLSTGRIRAVCSLTFQIPDAAVLYLPGDSRAIRDTIRHIYGLEPREIRARSTFDDIELWSIAHIYEVPTLIQAMEIRLSGYLRWHASREDIEHYTEVLRAVYQAPLHNHNLRSYATDGCAMSIGQLLQEEVFVGLLLEVPELAVDLLKNAYVMMEAQKRRG